MDGATLAAALVNRMSDAELATRLDAAYYLVYAEFFLERYEQAFRDNEIDERVLPKLTVDDL